MEDTEAAFKKEMEKVSDFTKAFHEMPEYKEITAKLNLQRLLLLKDSLLYQL